MSDGESEQDALPEIDDAKKKLYADHASAVDSIVEIYNKVVARVKDYDRREARLRLFTLALSVVTSGQLWFTLAQGYPQFAAYTGAVFTTIIAFLIGYQRLLRYDDRAMSSIRLASEIAAYLAFIRSRPEEFHAGAFWRYYKLFEMRALSSDTTSDGLDDPLMHELAMRKWEKESE
jgi:hypothetical protein